MSTLDWPKQKYTVTYALRHGWPWLLAILLALVSISLSFAYVQSETGQGGKEHWPESYAILNLRLGCPTPGLPLWGPCWDDAARHAAQQWNAAGAQFQFRFQSPSQPAGVSCTEDQIDEMNTALWTPNVCGRAWGANVVAITGRWVFQNGEINDADVLFNRNLTWNVYTGPARRAVEFHRVAMHEFGHVLGLAHPDDHGQRVTALMNSAANNIDRLQPDDIAGVRAIYGTAPRAPTTKGALGNPGHQTFKSGVGVISGWVCDAQNIEIQIGQTRYRAVYGSDRPDTRSECGDTNNGFVILFNYNRLGDGVHTARLVVDGRQLGNPAQFKVTTLGTEFLRGVEGGYWLLDFPRPGTDVAVGWDQGTQNFVIEERR